MSMSVAVDNTGQQHRTITSVHWGRHSHNAAGTHVMQESRVKRALERAAAPVFKKTGKPVMFRSQPPHKKTVQVLTENEDDDSDLQQFLAKDMLAA